MSENNQFEGLTPFQQKWADKRVEYFKSMKVAVPYKLIEDEAKNIVDGERKLYYKLDNGDVDQIVDSLAVCMEIIDGEWPDVVKDFKPEDTEDEAPEWTISPVWITQDEFENLPDAY